MEYSAEHGISKKVLVLCTSKEFAIKLCFDIQSRARYPSVGWEEGITCDVVHGDNKLENFSNAFLIDPSEATKHRTIVIVTPAVQCGHSIEKCVDKGFFFLYRSNT